MQDLVSKSVIMALNLTPKLLIYLLTKNLHSSQYPGCYNWLQIHASHVQCMKACIAPGKSSLYSSEDWHDYPCQCGIGILTLNDSNNWLFAVATQVQSRCTLISRGYRWVLNKIRGEGNPARWGIPFHDANILIPVVHLWNSPPGKHPHIHTQTWRYSFPLPKCPMIHSTASFSVKLPTIGEAPGHYHQAWAIDNPLWRDYPARYVAKSKTEGKPYSKYFILCACHKLELI